MRFSFYKNHPSKLVAVVVPLSNRQQLTPDEEISYRHLVHFLGKYDKFLVIPAGLQVDFPGFGIKRFHNKFFGSTEAHKKLLFSPKFYNAFRDYKYILIYHLDALAFSDQLTQWCEMDFDLIAPPWIPFKGAPYEGITQFEGKVGNGGFSLRKIDSFLKVIYSRIYTIEPAVHWRTYYGLKPKFIQYLNFPKRILKGLGVRNSAKYEMSRWIEPEDSFWANRATHYFPSFKIAPVELALRFAFECGPRFCFEKNNRELPFGCHGWEKYDREFWEPYLLK